MDVDNIDPAALTGHAYGHYPTPPPNSEEVAPQEPTKKKRKAWGQPVPEIKQILPPRKRAKTVEEKEQRKNERILRNRRAADKSRQRQKLAVADLEAKAARMEQEMAGLRATLFGYQQRFGVQKELESKLAISTFQSAPSPLDLDDDPETPSTSYSYSTPAPQEHPVFVPSEDLVSVKHESPALGPLLDITNESQPQIHLQEPARTALVDSTSVMTQYPAAILCDPQCQTEGGLTSLSMQTLQLGIILQTICWMTYQTFSISMLLPMHQIFQALGHKLAMSTPDQTSDFINHNFPLIHSLISMPSTPTRPAVFRMKLLSRLLACSPLMSRYLMAATERALQQVVSEDGFAENPDRRWSWASLMTIRWGILKLEREHRKIRRSKRVDQVNSRCETTIPGVDVGAVGRSSKLWTEPSNCMTIDQGWATATALEVH